MSGSANKDYDSGASSAKGGRKGTGGKTGSKSSQASKSALSASGATSSTGPEGKAGKSGQMSSAVLIVDPNDKSVIFEDHETEDQPEDFADDSDNFDELDFDENLSMEHMASDGDEQPAGEFSLKALPDSRHDPATLPTPAQGRYAERSKDSLHLYMHEISRFSMLTPQEELALARKVRDSGDPDAVLRMVSSHLRLVVRIAMDFQRRWMQNVLDLIQEGNVGLVRAVSKFDPEKGIKFSYYASFWIKAYILKFIMDNWRMVKIGTTQSQRKLFYNLNKERQRLISQGFDPDTKTLSENLNVTEAQIIEMEQRMDAADMSLNAPVSAEDSAGATRMDYLPALGPGIEEVLSNNEMSALVRERLSSLVPDLSDKEKYILKHRLLTDDPITLREIGEKYSITRERVRQIEARLTQKIRDHLIDGIDDFSKDWINR